MPLTNVVDVDVRFIAPLLDPLLNDMDEIDENPFDGVGLKKSSIKPMPMKGLKDVNNVLFCGCE